MKISHMVEGQHKAQGMDRILNRDISNHQGSSSSIKGVKAGMTIKVRGGPNHLKNRCCSSWDNKRLLHFHQQKLSDLEYFKSDTQVFQKNTSASLKNLETQVGQLALSIPNQTKGTFSSDTQKNPKDCMAFQLRSGKAVGNNNKKERKEETDAEQ